LCSCAGSIYSIHCHDSLLVPDEKENIAENEKEAAVQEYEKDKHTITSLKRRVLPDNHNNNNVNNSSSIREFAQGPSTLTDSPAHESQMRRVLKIMELHKNRPHRASPHSGTPINQTHNLLTG
jgi:hypothetical protein